MPERTRSFRALRGCSPLALLALALVAGCAGASSSGGSGGRGGSPMSFAAAVDAALARHEGARGFLVERGELGGHAVILVSLFEGTSPRTVAFDAANGAFVDDRADPPADDEEAASLSALHDRLGSTSTTLRTTLRMVEGRYIVADVSAVQLMMRSGAFLVRVVTGTGASATEHYHDGVTGDPAALPDAGVDAGPVDAGVDGGPDTGPRDAGRRR